MLQIVTPKKPWAEAFLFALANSGNIRAACQKVGIDRTSVYRYREADEDFSAAWDVAMEDARDLLEAMAWSRARGEKDDNGDYIREPSDTLLIFLLKCHRYGERVQVQHTGASGGPIQTEHTTTIVLEGLTPEEKKQLASEYVRRISMRSGQG